MKSRILARNSGALAAHPGKRRLDRFAEIRIFHGHIDARLLGQPSRGRHLVVRRMLALLEDPREQDDGFAALHGLDDAAHPRMGDDQGRLVDLGREFTPAEHAGEGHMGRFIFALADLREERVLRHGGRDRIHHPHQAIERKQRADGDEDHRTAPQ
jgi:hypothetical protein